MDTIRFDPVRVLSLLRPAAGVCLLALGLGLAGCDAPVEPGGSEDQEEMDRTPELESTSFTIEDLGSLNASRSGANAVNRDGEITGYTDSDSPQGEVHAFGWSEGGGMRDLGTIADGDWSMGLDIGPDGRIVGFSATRPFGDRRHAVLWSPDGRAVDLGELDGNTTVATAVNGRGQVAGTSYAPLESGGRTPHRAFLWTEEEGTRSLGTLPGADASWAEDLNREGGVVGTSGGRAFMWTPEEGMRDLGTLGGETSAARAINDDGAVVGVSETSDGRHRAFLWTEGDGMRGVGDADVERSAATGINGWGHAVGTVSKSSRGTDAFVWSESAGMRRLEALGSQPASGDALGINDSLVVVGSSLNSALDDRAVRWLPSRDGSASAARSVPPTASERPTAGSTSVGDRGSGRLAPEGADPLWRLQERLGPRWRGAVVVRPDSRHPQEDAPRSIDR